MDVSIDEVLKSMRLIIGDQAQKIAILEATIIAMKTPAPTTTAVTDRPAVQGPQGLTS